MATEQIAAFPDLRALRRAYERAIAASRAAHAVARSAVYMTNMPASMHRTYEAAWDEHHRRRAAEQEAGRAYMAALAEADPACRVCGCTTEDACDTEDGPCWWVSFDPPVCSACQGKEAQ